VTSWDVTGRYGMNEVSRVRRLHKGFPLTDSMFWIVLNAMHVLNFLKVLPNHMSGLGECQLPLIMHKPLMLSCFNYPGVNDSSFSVGLAQSFHLVLFWPSNYTFIPCYFYSSRESSTPACLLFTFCWAHGSHPLTSFWSYKQVDILWPCHFSAESFVGPIEVPCFSNFFSMGDFVGSMELPCWSNFFLMQRKRVCIYSP